MKKHILIPIVIIFLIVAFIVSYNKSTNEFIIDNDTKLNTKIINSYTIKSNGVSYTYERENEQFNDVNTIFENAELYHDRSRLYLYYEGEPNDTDQIILNNTGYDIVMDNITYSDDDLEIYTGFDAPRLTEKKSVSETVFSIEIKNVSLKESDLLKVLQNKNILINLSNAYAEPGHSDIQIKPKFEIQEQ